MINFRLLREEVGSPRRLNRHQLGKQLAKVPIDKRLKTDELSRSPFFTWIRVCIHIDLWKQISHYVKLLLTNKHPATSQVIDELASWNWTKLSNFPTIFPVYGYYIQTWIQMRKDDLAESSVLSWYAKTWCFNSAYT